MKRLIITYLLVLSAIIPLMAQRGVPFMRNYSAQEYGAHNRNFDIICGDNGQVFIANFEGLLYFDQAAWHVLHTKGIHRLTALFNDKKGHIWVGGYNYIGYLVHEKNGSLGIKDLLPSNDVPFHGQVEEIWQDASGSICLEISDHSVYCVQGDKLVPVGALPPDKKNIQLSEDYEVNEVIRINNDLQVVALTSQGLLAVDGQGRKIFQLTEESGLCNNNVNHIAYDSHGMLWGVTDNGIFAVSLPSIYSRFTSGEGLRGEVLAIQAIEENLFVGTLSGLFRRVGQSFVPVSEIKHACWNLEPDGNSLLAATMGGVFRVFADGSTRQLSTASATAVLPDDDGYYSGELDGLFYYKDNFRSEASNAEKVVRMFQDKDGDIWAQNLYGDIWLKPADEQNFRSLDTNKKEDDVNTLIRGEHEVLVANINGIWRWDGHKLVSAGEKMKALIPYPSYSYTDFEGNIWVTDAEGHELKVVRHEQLAQEHEVYITPLKDYVVRAILRMNSQLWVGGDFGLIGIKRSIADPMLRHKPQLFLRSITMQGDSLLWGGIGEQPKELGTLDSNYGELRISYAIDYAPLVGNATYRYRLNDGTWSAWSEQTFVRFFNMASGAYTMEIQACDPMGRLSNIVSFDFSIPAPFYMRWYMLLLFALLAALITYAIARWRTHSLEQDKLRLERVVQDRTAEIAKQKDELMHQEKMATVGKLTQGLIDRILNPMNYINNFSKLSSGLIKDVKANIEDEQEHMDPENYDDTMDVLDMLTQNLAKVEQHGINTSRTLKAMEEMLKDRTGGMVPMNVVTMLQKNFEMLNQYYQKEIEECHIKTVFDCPSELISINGNADQLSKTVMSLLGNGIYAVVKQKKRVPDHQPEIRLSAHTENNNVVIKVHDNGIGIESGILDKIFDPFFTTKTTGEASGIGLYLSHEIVQNHRGSITVNSEKNQFTEFDIVIPLLEKQ